MGCQVKATRWYARTGQGAILSHGTPVGPGAVIYLKGSFPRCPEISVHRPSVPP